MAAIFFTAPIVSDGAHRISVLVPSRLLMNKRMRPVEGVVTFAEDRVGLSWCMVRFFSIRDLKTGDLWCAEYLPPDRELRGWRDFLLGVGRNGVANCAV